jgi:selenide,water dikinase
LAGLPKFTHENLLVGLETSDDAGVYKLNEETALVQTVDFFSPIVDDPYQFGQIAAANALSDIYAMGGKPLTAMNLVCFPNEDLPVRVLKEILKGGAERIKAAGAVLVGGHTIRDKEIKYGLSVTGIVPIKDLKTNAGAKAGDVLILTKPLGTGIISTAIKRGDATRSDTSEIYRSMILLNDRAAELMIRHGAHAATDITGFGLVGHALEMAVASRVNIAINSANIPSFGSFRRFSSGKKYLTRGYNSNIQLAKDSISSTHPLHNDTRILLHDPQTSGGLLISIEKSRSEILLKELRSKGYTEAAIMGDVLKGNGRILIE